MNTQLLKTRKARKRNKNLNTEQRRREALWSKVALLCRREKRVGRNTENKKCAAKRRCFVVKCLSTLSLIEK